MAATQRHVPGTWRKVLAKWRALPGKWRMFPGKVWKVAATWKSFQGVGNSVSRAKEYPFHAAGSRFKAGGGRFQVTGRVVRYLRRAMEGQRTTFPSLVASISRARASSDDRAEHVSRWAGN